MDKIKLGFNIRKIRKEKNITLSQLASGLFSLGKMSNIENGITEISERELTLICEKLGVTKEKILPEDERLFLSNIEVKISEIENCLFLNFYEHAEYLIEDLEKTSQEHSTKYHLYYLRALLSYKRGEYKGAFLYFNKILNHIPTNEVELNIHAKSFNLVGAINYYLGDFYTASDMFQRAAELINDKMELSRIQFNLAVLYAAKGDTADSRMIIGRIDDDCIKKEPKILYLQYLLDILDGDFSESIENLYRLRPKFFKSNDYDTFIRSMLIIIYIHDTRIENIENYIKEIFNFLEMYFMRIANMKDYEDISILLAQSLLNIAIKNKDIQKAELILKNTEPLLHSNPNSSHNSFTYYLKAKYLELINVDIEEQKKLLTMALELFPDDSRSLFKGIIYYELAKFERNNSSFYQKSAEEFYESLIFKHINPIQLNHLYPKLYIY